jgi:hypothetical protein
VLSFLNSLKHGQEIKRSSKFLFNGKKCLLGAELKILWETRKKAAAMTECSQVILVLHDVIVLLLVEFIFIA